MPRPLRLALGETPFPVAAALDVLPDDIFLERIEQMFRRGFGFDFNSVGCTLPNDDNGDAPETGILFYCHHEELWLPNDQARDYILAAIKSYAEQNPSDLERAKSISALASATLGPSSR